jgi:formylglycine-generating enzyme required for sulfatase activity
MAWIATAPKCLAMTPAGDAHAWTGKEWKLDAKKSWKDPGFAQDDSHPVVCVNWGDAKAFAKWFSGKTGRDYRLPTEAEWEYACRAGSVTPFWWGSSISTEQANYDGNFTYGGGKTGEYRQKTAPIKTYQPNPWGLYQVHGNVWEWCEDCWNDNHDGAPADGSARTTGDCSQRVLRGGSWGDIPQDLRSASRGSGKAGIRINGIGFRLARTLNFWLLPFYLQPWLVHEAGASRSILHYPGSWQDREKRSKVCPL